MKSLWLLLAIFGVLVIVACGEATDSAASTTPDLEATVEARVRATIEAPMPTPSLMPTATVVARSTIVRLITEDYKSKIENFDREKDRCLLGTGSETGRVIKNTIHELASHDVNYLRSYYGTSDLSESDVQEVINYLENAAGVFERSCSAIEGLKFKGATGLKRQMDELYRKNTSNNGACHTSENMEKFARNLRYENIHYLRGLLDIDDLAKNDVRELSGHFESEAGRYARLCAQGQ